MWIDARVFFLTISYVAGKDEDMLGNLSGGSTYFGGAISMAQSCIEQGLQQHSEVSFCPCSYADDNDDCKVLLFDVHTVSAAYDVHVGWQTP